MEKNKDWIAIQCQKYAGSNFGETDEVVDRNAIAWQKLCEHAKSGMSFLDIGCNNGRMVLEMKNRGLQAWGVDLPKVIEKVTYPIDTIALNLEEGFPAFPIGNFDIIMCRETLEHIHNDEETCRKIISSLKPDGIAIITGPHSEEDFGEKCPEHIRLYKGKELKTLVQKCGGVIIEEFNETICRSHGVLARRRML